MENKSVLVVEDDKDARTTFSLILGIEGYQVIEAENGKKALEMLSGLPASQLPGMILLDMMMPVMDGRTLLKCLNENQDSRLKDIPVVITTANPLLLNENTSLQSEAQLTKPVDLDLLCSVVRDHYRKPAA